MAFDRYSMRPIIGPSPPPRRRADGHGDDGRPRAQCKSDEQPPRPEALELVALPRRACYKIPSPLQGRTATSASLAEEPLRVLLAGPDCAHARLATEPRNRKCNMKPSASRRDRALGGVALLLPATLIADPVARERARAVGDEESSALRWGCGFRSRRPRRGRTGRRGSRRPAGPSARRRGRSRGRRPLRSGWRDPQAPPLAEVEVRGEELARRCRRRVGFRRRRGGGGTRHEGGAGGARRGWSWAREDSSIMRSRRASSSRMRVATAVPSAGGGGVKGGASLSSSPSTGTASTSPTLTATRETGGFGARGRAFGAAAAASSMARLTASRE